MSEFDRQVALLRDKIDNPDKVIRAYSVLKVEGKQIGEDKYWFLTEDDEVVLVDMTEELPPQKAAGIALSELTPDDVGRWVTYRSSGGDKVEPGRIKSWNDSGVFVVYGQAAFWDAWQEYTAAHTRPEDLEFDNANG